MNNTRGLIPIIACSCLVAIVYLVVAFAIPFLQTPSYWVAFAFGWFAIIIAILTNVYVISASTAQGALYRSSLSAISIIYLIIAAGVSIGFMAAPLSPIWLIILVQVLLAAACIAILIVSARAATYIQTGEAKTQQEIAFIRNITMQVQALEPLAASPAAKQEVGSLAEALRYTDPVSTPALMAIDQELANLIAALRDALTQHDDERAIALCEQAKQVVAQRAVYAISSKQ